MYNNIFNFSKRDFGYFCETNKFSNITMEIWGDYFQS